VGQSNPRSQHQARVNVSKARHRLRNGRSPTLKALLVHALSFDRAGLLVCPLSRGMTPVTGTGRQGSERFALCALPC
jgi:hypothetical protein